MGIRDRQFHYQWQWQLEASPDALWPLVADTNRFNADTSLPAVRRGTTAPPALANARKHLYFYRMGIRVEWEEEPFEWVRPQRFGVVRRYWRGPVAEMHVLATLTPHTGGGTLLNYEVWARPRTILGLLAIPIQIGWLSARAFDATFRRYDRMISAQKSPLDLDFEGGAPASLVSGGEARLADGVRVLTARYPEPELVGRLAEWLRHADDLTAARLRPYGLADHWGYSRRTVLELCLWATRVGLLAFQWHVLCPMCRGSAQRHDSLHEVRTEVHCDSCNIDFTANFEHAVELTFRPNPAIREVPDRSFCVGGPQVTPHIVLQQLLPAATRRSFTLPLEVGRYRMRTLTLPGGRYLQVAPQGAATANLRAEPQGWPNDELLLAPDVTLALENDTQDEQLFVLERLALNDDAVTAADVFALQTFRDLFAQEALRPGDPVSVGSLAVVFTDLRRSTHLYREIGDAVAFGLVMDHFDVLRAAIQAEGGAIVKTIGDAVMAVFRRPVAALRAVLQAQQTLAATSRPQALHLRAGIHYGPCIAVTLNDRMDYFGTTINVAARLEAFSSGDDLVISSPVRADPEVAAWLDDARQWLDVVPLTATLKGFEEVHELWRVMPAHAGAPGGRLEPVPAAGEP